METLASQTPSTPDQDAYLLMLGDPMVHQALVPHIQRLAGIETTSTEPPHDISVPHNIEQAINIQPVVPEPHNIIGATISMDPDRIRAVQDRIHLPSDVPLKGIYVIDAIDKAQLDATKDYLNSGDGMRGSPASWREQVFGNENVETLKNDIATRLEMPVAERTGSTLQVNGVERRAIMNIELSEASAQEVAATIAERDRGLESALTQLQAAKEQGKKLSSSAVQDILYTTKIVGRHHSNLLDSPSKSPGGTIADLYIDSRDLQRYDAIDALAQELSPPFDSKLQPTREQIAEQVVVLASNTFPSGVELMHVINRDNVSDVIEHGAITPRSQRKHGVGNSTRSLNGGFVHLVGPGGYASEYGKTVVGVPIDTIFEHSPFMQLEDDYTGNRHSNLAPDGSNQPASDQYHMGAVELRSLDDAPLAFQTAFRAMQANIQKGLLHSPTASGSVNNLSFAAGSNAESAAAYSYPLEEVSIYVDNGATAKEILQAAQKAGKLETVAARTTYVAVVNTIEAGVGLNVAPLPNFAMPGKQPMKFFAPLSTREVGFVESTTGNSRNFRTIKHSLETVSKSSLPEYLDGLIRDGLPVKEAFDAAVEAVVTSGASGLGLLQAYLGGKEVFEAGGITAETLFSSLSDRVIDSTNFASGINSLQEREPPNLKDFDEQHAVEIERWVVQGGYASHELKQQLMQIYANHLFAVNPDTFAERMPLMEQYDIVISSAQQAALTSYQARMEAIAEVNKHKPRHVSLI